MRLRGVPAELRVGPVELRAIGPKCTVLQPCIHCKLCHMTYFLCYASHVICLDCFLNESTEEQVYNEQLDGFCSACDASVTFTRFEITPLLISSLKFFCGCDFVGPLSEIRKHVMSAGFSQKCCEPDERAPPPPPTSTNEFDVKLTKLNFELKQTLDDFEERIRHLQQKLKENFESKIDSTTGPKAHLYQVALESQVELQYLNERLRELAPELSKLKEFHTRNLARAVFLFRHRAIDPVKPGK